MNEEREEESLKNSYLPKRLFHIAVPMLWVELLIFLNSLSISNAIIFWILFECHWYEIVSEISQKCIIENIFPR